ncbi:DUF2804 domain-containing protein [Vibrio tapetis subsp. quintayensis]|uniref:DUF2804 domain-containing protein n=1 Tax=Vibrio tapetis TaxID=52443 RepID=UPI0025B341B6|nr:DUF2804 domain-containing protein [Vibrio tapetis]MDN3680802.1 DUF2804 domain-containing protein [Vibrio tapetis subsp. quintayensis]
MTSTRPAPESLISIDGKPVYGHFDGIPENINAQRFDYRDCMDKSAGKLAKYFHYKQFQFVSLRTERYLIGVAIADIRYLGSSFCYVYDIENDGLIEKTWLRPLSFGKKMASSSYSGDSHIVQNKLHFEIKQGLWRVQANCKHLELDVHLQPSDGSMPLSVCTPTAYSGWTYTQKHNALSVKGSLKVDDVVIELEDALAGYDFSAGYMRRETSWRWASISTQIDGSLLGLNLAAGVNETGSCENALWVDGRRHLLNSVHFTFDRDHIEQDWHIHSEDGRLDLHFTPVNKRSEKLNLLLLKSNFRQFIGHFSGFIIDTDGAKHELSNVLGLTEDHFAKW